MSDTFNTVDSKNNLGVVHTESLTLKHFRTYIQRLTTANTAKQGKPDLRINNPFNTQAVIYSISLIPNAQSKTDAVIEMFVNEDQTLVIDAGELTDIGSFNLPIPLQGIPIDPQKFIDIFFWNQGVSSSLTVIVSFGVK